MKKGLLGNLARIIFCIICAIWIGFSMISTSDGINKEISGENREAYIQILDKKAKRIEDTGLTLEELTDEDIDEYTISKSEIDGYYVFKFEKGGCEVRIYFDSEENIISVQKEYPEVNSGGIIILWMMLFLGIPLIAVFIAIGLSIYKIREIIVENKKERKQELEE